MNSYEWNAISSTATITFGGVKKLVNVVCDQGFKATTVKLPAYGASATVLTAPGGPYSVHSGQASHFEVVSNL